MCSTFCTTRQKVIKSLYRLTQDPDAWWLGQFVGFLLRPGQEAGKLIDDAANRIDFSGPVVGVHVR